MLICSWRRWNWACAVAFDPVCSRVYILSTQKLADALRPLVQCIQRHSDSQQILRIGSWAINNLCDGQVSLPPHTFSLPFPTPSPFPPRTKSSFVLPCPSDSTSLLPCFPLPPSSASSGVRHRRGDAGAQGARGVGGLGGAQPHLLGTLTPMRRAQRTHQGNPHLQATFIVSRVWASRPTCGNGHLATLPSPLLPCCPPSWSDFLPVSCVCVGRWWWRRTSAGVWWSCSSTGRGGSPSPHSAPSATSSAQRTR